MTIAVVGLGRIGAPLAACLSASGHDVVGIDIDEAKVDAVNAGRAPVAEPGLEELLTIAPFAATNDVAALDRVDVVFVVLPTHAGDDAALTVPGLDELATVIRSSRCGSVALVSTVMPGTTRAFASAAEKPVCFAPEFVALGRAVRDFREPSFALFGGDGARVEDVLRAVWTCDVPTLHMSYEEAELAKLALNAFLATKVSFANVVGEQCAIAGCDPERVLAALELDPRVGRGYLTAGAPFGGPCLPRDTAALRDRTGLLDAVLGVNDDLVDRLCAQVTERVRPGARIALCGVAFKAGTGVVERSPALAVAKRLTGAGYDVVGVDRLVDERDVPFALERSVGGCDAALLLTREDFGPIAAPVVIDAW